MSTPLPPEYLGGPAFPATLTAFASGTGGASRRDLFIMASLQGMLANPNVPTPGAYDPTIVDNAVMTADAALNAAKLPPA